MARPSMNPEEVETMRSRLAAAALELYRSEGLDAISFRRIADATGISYTLPYRYFENKDALLARMRVEALGRFEQTIRSHEARADSGLARIHAVADGYIAFALEHRADYLLVFASHQPPAERYPELLAARRQVFDHAVEVIQDCIDAGLLHGDARDLAHAFWVTMHGAMMLHSVGQLVHGRELEEIRRPLIDRLLASAVQAPTAAPDSSQATSSVRSRNSILKQTQRRSAGARRTKS